MIDDTIHDTIHWYGYFKDVFTIVIIADLFI